MAPKPTCYKGIAARPDPPPCERVPHPRIGETDSSFDVGTLGEEAEGLGKDMDYARHFLSIAESGGAFTGTSSNHGMHQVRVTTGGPLL